MKITLLGIVLLGIGLRCWQLSITPPVNRDELAIGYNAYSVLKTQMDEHGAGSYPVTFQSFGDYKLPGLIYAAMPMIKLFGLSVLATRMTTTMLGILLIPLTYILAKHLFNSSQVGLLSSLMIAITPWHIHGSRSAYEPIAGLTIQVLALVMLIKTKPIWLAIISYLALSFLAMLFYNDWVILFMPMLILTGLTLREKIFKQPRIMLAATVMGIVMITGSMLVIFGDINTSRYQTTIFSQTNIDQELPWERLFLTTIHIPLIIGKLFTNRISHMAYRFIGSYLSSFNPSFLFNSGGNNAWHNLQSIGYGNFQIYDLILIGLTIVLLVRKKLSKFPPVSFLIGWLLISPLAHAITVDTPNTNRLMNFHFLLILLSAYGLHVLIGIISDIKWAKWLVGTVVGGMLVSFGVMYFGIYTPSAPYPYQPGAIELVQALKSIEDRYEQIFIGDFDLAYIYFAFFRPIEPDQFIAYAKWENNGLDMVTHFDKYQFVIKPRQLRQIKLSLLVEAEHNTLVIQRAAENDELQNAVLVIRNAYGQPLWKAYTTPHIDAEEYLIDQEK